MPKFYSFLKGESKKCDLELSVSKSIEQFDSTNMISQYCITQVLATCIYLTMFICYSHLKFPPFPRVFLFSKIKSFLPPSQIEGTLEKLSGLFVLCFVFFFLNVFTDRIFTINLYICKSMCPSGRV